MIADEEVKMFDPVDTLYDLVIPQFMQIPELMLAVLTQEERDFIADFSNKDEIESRKFLTIQKNLDGKISENVEAVIEAGAEVFDVDQKSQIKKPISAYRYFADEMGPSLDGKTLRDRSRILSKKWKKLTDEEREKYDELHNNDVARYNKATGEKPKVKRPRSAYLIFAMQNRLKYAEKKESMGQINKKLSEIWKNLTEEEKAPYFKSNQEDLERYQKECQEAGIPYTDAKKKSKKRKRSESDENLNGLTSPIKKKRKRSSYHMWASKERAIIKEEGGMQFGKINAELGKRWKALSEQDRAYWDNKQDSEDGTTNKPKKEEKAIIELKEKIEIIDQKLVSVEAAEKWSKMGYEIIDVSGKGWSKWNKFYLGHVHGDAIPVNAGNFKDYEDVMGTSVLGIFDGLKIFSKKSFDDKKIFSGKLVILRTLKKNGKLLGWAKGLPKKNDDGDYVVDVMKDLWSKKDARWNILINLYKFVLDNLLVDEVKELQTMLNNGKKIILVDASSGNNGLSDYKKELTAAPLLKMYLEKRWPDRATVSKERKEQRLKRRQERAARKLKAGEKTADEESDGEEEEREEGEEGEEEAEEGEEEEEEEEEQKTDGEGSEGSYEL